MEKPLFEAEIVDGLEEFAVAELKKAGAKIDVVAPGVIRFRFGKSLMRLLRIRVVNQVFQIYTFDIPRPKALLGQQHFDQICRILQRSIQQLGPADVKSFRLEAAGRDSAVFQRLIAQISEQLKIPHDANAGDLFLRVAPSQNKGRKGWELLVRNSIRPLATRPWRQFNYPGALAAPVASVMLELSEVKAHNKILNLMCGSGTLLAENFEENALSVGCDLNQDALTGAQLNLEMAGIQAKLFLADAVQLPFVDNSFDVILSDLPWGQLVGDVSETKVLYPLILKEAYRVVQPGGRFIVITQLKKLMVQSIQSSEWGLARRIPLKIGRVNPDIFILEG